MSFFAATWFQFLRLMRNSRRVPVFVVMSIVQPVIWILLFSQLFRSVAAIPGFEGTSYIQYVAPGIAVMSALFGAAFTGMGLLGDIDRGVLDRMLVAPAAHGAIIAGRIAHAGAVSIAQSTILLGVALLRGARPHGGALGVVTVALAASLLGSSFAGVSSTIALLARRQEVIMAITNFLLLPMIYLSTMLMSKSLMPGWMASAARFNPVNWAVGAARAGFEGRDPGGVALRLGLLVLFALACSTLATLAFRRYRALA